MPLKIMPYRARESPAQGRFRLSLDTAVSSASNSGGRVDPTALDSMLSMIRSKELSPGDALSCFKNPFREGAPDEQLSTLRVLIQLVDSDPHLANLLHAELASRRWRERFVALAASPHPEVRPLLISTLSGWSSSYRAHDIGMHYQNTLKELTGISTFRSGYITQYTGYSAQATGYSSQATGAGYPGGPVPPPGYPAAHPAVPTGYPVYGGVGPTAYPPPVPPHHPPPRNEAATLSSKVDQLASEMELLRVAIRSFELALADYKAQRAPFSSLSAAMERGQSTADRCTSLQAQLEALLGSSDGGDEALMGRVFSTNDAAVALVEQWKKLANQELAPDDTPAPAAAVGGASLSPSAAGASASAGGGISTSAVPAASPPKPPPSPIDLLLGDELPAPAPAPAPPTFPAANGSAAWPAAAAATPPSARAIDSATAAAAAGGAFFGGAGAAAGFAAAGSSAPVAPAADVEGLRAQVLALSAELDKQRRLHQTNMEAQAAFHQSEMAQVKAQFQARIAEVEAALSRQQLQQQPSGGAALGVMGSLGGAAAPSLYGASSAATPALPLPPPPQPAGGGASTNPFASLAAAAPTYGAAAPAPVAVPGPFVTGPPPLASPTGASGGGGAGAMDFFAGMPTTASGPAPVAGASARAPLPPDLFSEPSSGGGGGAPAAAPPARPFGSLPAPLPGPAATAAPAAPVTKPATSAGGSWVDFGL